MGQGKLLEPTLRRKLIKFNMNKKINIVVYALSLADHIKNYGVNRIESLKRIKTKHNIDIKIFIDQDQSLEHQQLFDSNVEFVDIRKNLTPDLRKLSHSDAVISDKRTIGYKGMCLFNFSEYINYLEGYDYAIRLDGDSIIHSDLYLDDFISTGKVHGYVRDKLDGHKETQETLPGVIKKYIRENEIEILCDENDINMEHYYSNFGIIKLDFWKSDPVVKFMNFIKQEDGICKYRWGDHVLQANILKMFCPPGSIVKFDFKYEHGSHEFKNFK